MYSSPRFDWFIPLFPRWSILYAFSITAPLIMIITSPAPDS